MRIFIGSSKEQQRLVEWLTEFMRTEYSGILEPVPWTISWPGGHFLLENLLNIVRDTDAAILFWTADDKTWYRGADYNVPRDNLVFEAGLFMGIQGRERTQLMVPNYDPSDERNKQKAPTDVAGLTYYGYRWVDGPPEATGLPNKARSVCDRLRSLGSRPRAPEALERLRGLDKITEIQTFAGEWGTMHMEGIKHLAASTAAREIDILAVYRVGEIRRVLDGFRRRGNAHLRACFANMWDNDLLKIYQRKYHDRTDDHIRNALSESIEYLIGPCKIQIMDGPSGQKEITVTELADPPLASFEIRLTNQRITYSYYRIDNHAFVVPLDMKKRQNPAPLAWVFARDTAQSVFDHYIQEYVSMFEEAQHVYPE